jgi:RimJ/RimL family protein N-acetyltransferase
MTSQESNVHVETSRLSLRPVLASDVADLFRIYGDPATNTFNPAGPYPDIDYAKAVLIRWLDHWHTTGSETGQYHCAIVLKQSLVLAG